jgi:hypothetical protein
MPQTELKQLFLKKRVEKMPLESCLYRILVTRLKFQGKYERFVRLHTAAQLSHWEEPGTQEPDCGSENGRNVSEDYSRPPSVTKLIRFRLRWAIKSAITKVLVRLTEVRQKI